MNALLNDASPVADSSKPAVPRVLLVLGLVGGAALAAAGLVVGTIQADLPPQAVARVNQRLILRDAWLRAVAAVASERRAALTDEDQRRILDRLIDEELLVQHGIALGLVEQDARIRSELVSEVMLAATTAESADLTEDTLQRFYNDNIDFFTPPARLRVAVWRMDAAGKRMDFQPPLPNLLLPPAKLQTYLGPALTAKALSLRPNEPIETAGGAGGRVVLEVLEKQASEAPAFERIKDQVKSEARRRADEAAVRALLADLRSSNRVVVKPNLP